MAVAFLEAWSRCHCLVVRDVWPLEKKEKYCSLLPFKPQRYAIQTRMEVVESERTDCNTRFFYSAASELRLDQCNNTVKG